MEKKLRNSDLYSLLKASRDTCLVVAELSANHAGSVVNAVDLVHQAAGAGASAVKIQTYRAESITLKSSAKSFRIAPESPWASFGTLWDLYSAGTTPREWHSAIFAAGLEAGVPVFASPFSPSDVAFLESLNCPAYKIASPEIGYTQLLDAVSQTGKPVLLSTGVALEEDIEKAVGRLRRTDSIDITVMKCTSSYPAPIDEQHLSTMVDISERWQVRPGFSDHTTSTISGAVAVSLGAQVIEKHFRGGLDEGLDDFFSLDIEAFSDYVRAVRHAEALRGTVNYSIAPCATSSRRAMRSLYFTRELSQGHVVIEQDLAIVRPSGGLPPEDFAKVVGAVLRTDVTAGSPVLEHLLEFERL
jgi:pseudaminic acid synthase